MILIDTNILVAMASARDDLHSRAMALVEALPNGQLVLPTVLAEACFLINQRNGVATEVALLQSFAEGDFTLGELRAEDLVRMAEIVERYADLDLGATDASVVAVAERLGIDTVATFDRRHFSVVRPRHVRAFTLLPQDPSSAR